LLVFAGAAESELFVFSGHVDGRSVSLQLDSVQVGKIDYVSLPALVKGLDGSVKMREMRMRADLPGITAWVAYEDERVSYGDESGAANMTVSLAHPVSRAGSDVLIAVRDVTDFFAKVFQVPLTQSGGVEERRTVSIFRGGRTEFVDSGGSRLGRRRTLGPAQPEPSPQSWIESIIVDPGHGGFDKGLEGSGGLLEKDVALAVGSALRDALAARVKRKVILTREGDLGLTRKERVLRASEHPGGILISIHAAGSFSPLARGFAVYHGPPKNKRGTRTQSQTATRLRARLGVVAVDQSSIIAQHLADALETATGSSPRFSGEAPMRLLESVGMYGAHIEVGCITNPDDESLLKSDEHIQLLASAIAEGIAAYLHEPSRESAPLEPSDKLLR
jgi:N-acetylmuramoyl-L-alanine amidase